MIVSPTAGVNAEEHAFEVDIMERVQFFEGGRLVHTLDRR
jgi:hypothetical protein